MRLPMLAFLSVGLMGCHTLHFVNGPQMEETVVREKWHHLAINGLIEISPPFDIEYNCANQQWDTITTEKTFLNVLAGVSTEYVSIYSPWSMVYACREPIDAY